MAEIQVDIDENDVGEVSATLQLEAETVTSRLEEVIAKYSLLIARDAKKNAPVDTGRLRASIIPVLENLTAEIVAGGKEIVGTNVDYAAVQEFGNKEGGITGKKYMTKAFKKHRDDFEKEVQAALAAMGQ